MPGHQIVGGAAKQLQPLHINIGGEAKRIIAGHQIIGGVAKRLYTSGITGFVLIASVAQTLRNFDIAGVEAPDNLINLGFQAQGVAATSEYIYVIDLAAKYLRVWDLQGNRQASQDIALPTTPPFVGYTGIATTPDRIYVGTSNPSPYHIVSITHAGIVQTAEQFSVSDEVEGMSSSASRIYALIGHSNDLYVRVWDHNRVVQASENIDLSTAVPPTDYTGLVSLPANLYFLSAGMTSALYASDYDGNYEQVNNITIPTENWAGGTFIS